jgi:hypothetical protein
MYVVCNHGWCRYLPYPSQASVLHLFPREGGGLNQIFVPFSFIIFYDISKNLKNELNAFLSLLAPQFFLGVECVNP